jgi:type II secretory pathway pseudopilin PulG
MSAAGNDSGTTLLELLVVIGLMSLIAMIGVPDFEHEMDLLQLKEAASTIQSNLRIVRSDALRSNQPVTFSLSGDGKGYGWSEGETRRVPGQVELRMSKGQSILFYGDGTTTGGAVVASSGGREISIVVDDATGAVSTER